MSQHHTYEAAGVDITAGNQLIEAIKPIVKQTHRSEVIGGLGGFAGLFQLPIDRYQQPILVSCTDGVGTKLKLAIELDQHDTIGIDLVAMCANDLIACGAEPLFFLDYYATGKLQVATGRRIIAGIAEGCKQAGMALIGGETAEMPGMYNKEDYDLAGFCVGIVEKANLIDANRVRSGDILIALAASGFHSNGYSLIRSILADANCNLTEMLNEIPLGEQLLIPTRIYVKAIQALLQQITLHGIAHITGGGITENLPRVLPSDLAANINRNSWKLPPLFQWLQQLGKVELDHFFRVFNCGVGMILVVDPKDVDLTLALLQQQNETAWVIGEVIKANDHQSVHYYYG